MATLQYIPFHEPSGGAFVLKTSTRPVSTPYFFQFPRTPKKRPKHFTGTQLFDMHSAKFVHQLDSAVTKRNKEEQGSLYNSDKRTHDRVNGRFYQKVNKKDL